MLLCILTVENFGISTQEIAENLTQLLTQLMLLREMITAYSQDHTKHVNYLLWVKCEALLLLKQVVNITTIAVKLL
jgi:hypothetical protein